MLFRSDSRAEQAGYLVDLKLFGLAVRRFWGLNNRFSAKFSPKRKHILNRGGNRGERHYQREVNFHFGALKYQ